MEDNITNMRLAEIADGWLVLDFNSDIEEYIITLEYHNGDLIEMHRYSKWTTAYKKFNSLAEKLA